MTIEARSTSNRTNAAAYSLQSAAILGALCALLYYSTASLELALRPPGALVAMMSPQSAVLVAFLWAIPQRSWGIVALVTPPAHLLAYMGSGPWWQLAWQLAQILLLAIGIGSTLHLLLGQRAPMERLPDFLLYVVTAVVAAPLLLSGFAPSVAQALWTRDMAEAAAHWRGTVLASSLAMLTWAPCVYIGLQRGSRGRQRTPISAGVVGISVAVTVIATLLAAVWQASRVDLQIFLWLMAFTALVVAIAVEEQRRSARAASEYLLALSQRDRALEAANRSLARFARLATLGQNTASIAHEMNQPLGAIGYNAEAGLLYLAREHYDPATFRDIFDDICRDHRRASELIRRMREMLQDDELRLDRLDVNDVVADAVRLMRIESRRRQTLLITQLDDVPPLLGDHGRLREVLLNLIVNGMDAMDAVPERLRQITIRTSCVDAARIQVKVVDRGSGIDPEDRSKIFDSFFTSKDHGMGLGLAIARSIVEAHGGRIWAENNADGVGATLAFEISCNVDSARRMPVPGPATRDGVWLN